jgi:hypothetical protein
MAFRACPRFVLAGGSVEGGDIKNGFVSSGASEAFLNLRFLSY